MSPSMIRVGAFIAVVALFVFGRIVYVQGFKLGSKDWSELQAENYGLHKALIEFKDDYVVLKKQNVSLSQSSELDKKTTTELKRQIYQIELEKSKLEKSNQLYKQILATEQSSKSLSVESFRLQPLSAKGTFQYQFALTQNAKTHSLVSGKTVLSIQGAMAGNYMEVFPQVTSKQFRLKYMQKMTGTVVLPDGFAPESVKIVIQTKNKSILAKTARFDWRGAMASV